MLEEWLNYMAISLLNNYIINNIIKLLLHKEVIKDYAAQWIEGN